MSTGTPREPTPPGHGTDAVEVPRQPARVAQLDESLVRDRLRRARVARLGFANGDQPMIVPVNIRIDDDEDVVFRTAADGLLSALDGHKVAIEIDGHDPGLRSGWSILVQGVARDVTEATDPGAVRLRAVPVDCWAPGRRDRYFAVLPLAVHGRVIHVSDDGDWFAGVPGS